MKLLTIISGLLLTVSLKAMSFGPILYCEKFSDSGMANEVLITMDNGVGYKFLVTERYHKTDNDTSLLGEGEIFLPGEDGCYKNEFSTVKLCSCLLYTSPSPRDS